MIRLVYVSCATDPFDGAALDELLAVSRANNTRDGITGMLLCAMADPAGLLISVMTNRSMPSRKR